jgi:hypothetical protein
MSAGVSVAVSHREFESEQAFLHHAYRCLNAMSERAANAGDAGADPKSSTVLEKERTAYLERLHDPDSILFGRLDFDEGEQHYIGPRRIYDADQKLVAISWASEVAKPFYEASSSAPLGIELRRRLQTQKEQLLGIADEFFGAVAPEPTLDDLLLDELGRDRAGEMQQVAATIQQDQYRIIERPIDSATVVQGGPGTGKTVVGLHRAALLLYRNRERLGAQRMLVIGPNRVFMQYIQYVLPSLGETAADQLTPEALVAVSAGDDDESLVALVKGDERMATVLERALYDRVRPPDGELKFATNGIVFSVPASTIRELIDGARTASGAYLAARLQFRATCERAVEEAYRSAFTAARPGMPLTAISGRRLPEFERATDRIWPTVSAADFVRQFLSSEERIERAAGELLTPVQQVLLRRKPVERLEQVRWSPSDLPLIDEVQALLDPVVRRYAHVVIDESQDLTPMQLRMIGRRISGESVTVLGDLAQATGLWSYSTWDEVMSHLLGRDTKVEVSELTYAYRVPREIMELALPVLKLTAPSIRPPTPFRDGGAAPKFISVSHDGRVEAAITNANDAHESGGTAAIIAPQRLLQQLREQLEARAIAFADAERGELGTSIELLDPVASKGLEFDHVVVVEPAAIIRNAQGQGQRDLYVALTRATRTLTCIHSEPLPWPLGEDVPTPTEPAVVVQAAEQPEPVQQALASANGSEQLPTTLPAVSVELSLAEALTLVQMRGLDLGEALARVQLALQGGADELDLPRFALNPELVDAASVRSIIDAATRERRADPDEDRVSQ